MRAFLPLGLSLAALLLHLATRAAAQADCNSNGVDDAEDLARGTSRDCDGDGFPDECPAGPGFSFAFRQRLRPGSQPDGGYPPALLARDLDGDGRVDFAAARHREQRLSFLWNEGGHRFIRVRDVDLPYRPWALAAADFDGDGDLDFAVGQASPSPPDWGHELAIVRNDGARELALDRLVDLGERPYWLDAGDFDGDGAPDLVVTHGAQYDDFPDSPPQWDTVVSVLWNDGRGGFLVPERLSVEASSSVDIYAVDLSGDGLDDILALHWRGLPVLRLSRPGRRFGPIVRLPQEAGDGPIDAAFADLDDDGDLDVALGHGDTNRVTLLKNDGSGGLSFLASFREERNTDKPCFADVDGDGLLDLVAGNSHSTIWFAGAEGLPRVREFVRYACGGPVMSRALLDVDEDGWPDIVTYDRSSGSWGEVSVLYNRGGGRFGSPRIYYTYDPAHFWTGPPQETVAADFDLDGDLDIVSGRGFPWEGLGVMFSWNDGLGGFERHQEIEFRGTDEISARALAAADLDRDGDADLIAAGGHGWGVLENVEGRGLALRAEYEDIGSFFHHCVAADFDGNGFEDFVVGSDWGGLGGSWDVVWNEGDWNFERRVAAGPGTPEIDANVPETRSFGHFMGLGAGDWDRDGLLDLVMLQTFWTHSRVRLLFGLGERAFGREREIRLEREAWALKVADLDGDGIEDLVVTEGLVRVPGLQALHTTSSSRVLVYLGDGRGGFRRGSERRTAEFQPQLSTGDVDGDGDLDVFVSGRAEYPVLLDDGTGLDQVELFLNRGDGSLGRRVILPVGGEPGNVVVHDFNRDGLPDLAVTLRSWVLLAVVFNEATVPAAREDAQALSCEPRFVRGNLRGTGDYSAVLSDAIVLLVYLFRAQAPPACLDAGDTDDNGRLDLSDAVFLLNLLFRGGPVLPPPYPECGEDPTPDELGCEEYMACPQ